MSAAERVLVVNAGGGSLKLSLLAADDELIDGEAIDAAPDSDEARSALRDFLDRIGPVDAVGHRVVHGGAELSRHAELTGADGARVLAALEVAAELAPLHVPPALAAIRICLDALPDVPQVACLDTVFHADLPEAARVDPLPAAWRDRFGLRRYGFHGLSYTWAVRRAAALLDRPVERLDLVLTHLGSGASVCAVRGGRSVWCSMGFTPLEGLPMMTRSGSVDPGLVLWLLQQGGLSVDEVADGLEHAAGLTALSRGLSGDTRVLVEAAGGGPWGDPAGDHRPDERDAARLALEVYSLRVRQHLAAAAACLPRLDAVVFTGEIGADQPEIRAAVCEGLAVLGLGDALDPARNAAAIDTDEVLTRPDAPIPVVLVQPREDRQIAAETRAVVRPG
ncbi:acetate/propionate family kinase [Nakamurella leprariae]|uniref:Acetate kinase n=1 Tax=Nakamurella leprariae TaxID=2803911 RepID=A0A938YJD5_9ACTN|nr:hypothetical protein [Nakamurella leprariae]MBM9469372.1 hypothetical protein [Nakamurella leprariae]